MKHFLLLTSLLVMLIGCAHAIPTVTSVCDTQAEWEQMWNDAFQKASKSSGMSCRIDAVDPAGDHWVGKVKVRVDFPDVLVYFTGVREGEEISFKNRFKDALGGFDGYVGY